MKRFLALIFIVGLLVGSIALLLVHPQKVADKGSASVAWLADNNQANSDSFKRVFGPSEIVFPRDLGAHDDYQTEWWYYTGNLETATGRPFGFQLTIFRRGLTPSIQSVSTENRSDWRTNQVYFAHFTISDIGNKAFYPAERFSRGAAGLAGAQAVPYRVWLQDWSFTEIAPGQVQLAAKTDQVALDLVVKETLPPILQGDRGYSAKSSEPGNASYYYSIVRQETTGKVTVKGESFEVKGLTWKDHEYSTSSLSADDVGWDWFSLQLDNDTALMLYLLRRKDGTIESVSSGSFITADGTVQPLNNTDWQLEVLDTWKSPTSKAEYPAKWRLAIPKLALNLEGQPLMPNQELNLSTTYWEGAVNFKGTQAGKPVQARGYVEMTGYTNTLADVL
jgi:predicted secreted hydrolase